MHKDHHRQHQIGFSVRVRPSFIQISIFCLQFLLVFRSLDPNMMIEKCVDHGSFHIASDTLWQDRTLSSESNKNRIGFKCRHSPSRFGVRLPWAMFQSNTSWSSRRFRTAPNHLHRDENNKINFVPLNFEFRVNTYGWFCMLPSQDRMTRAHLTSSNA